MIRAGHLAWAERTQRLGELLTRARAGYRPLGLSISFDCPPLAELGGRLGFDWCQINMEHTLIQGLKSLVEMIRACELTGLIPLVKPSDFHPTEFRDALDAGAYGLVIPFSESASQVREMIECCRFLPIGTRGYCSFARGTWYGSNIAAGMAQDTMDFLKFHNESVLIIPTIETKKGVENIEELFAVPNTPVFHIGPNDLARAYNLNESDPADVKYLNSIVRDVSKKCRAAGKLVMIPTKIPAGGKDASINTLNDLGNDLPYASDTNMLVHSMLEALKIRDAVAANVGARVEAPAPVIAVETRPHGSSNGHGNANHVMPAPHLSAPYSTPHHAPSGRVVASGGLAVEASRPAKLVPPPPPVIDPLAPTAEVLRELAPEGKLRVGLLLSNPVLVNKRPDASGEWAGVSVDIGREFARRLGVPYEAIGHQEVADLANSFGQGTYDIGFFAFAPARLTIFDYARQYMDVENTYLVPAGSRIRSFDEVDRPGVRIGVPAKGAPDLFLTKNIQHAELVRTNGGDDTAVEVLTNGSVDAFAENRHLLDTASRRMPGSRVFKELFLAVPQSLAVPKGTTAGIVFVRALLEELKSSGFVGEVIRRHAIVGVRVGDLGPAPGTPGNMVEIPTDTISCLC